MGLAMLVERLHSMRMTPKRAMWLEKMHKESHWIRDSGQTINTRSDRKMPEPIYFWLVDNELIDVDCGDITVSAAGIDLLAAGVVGAS